VKILFLHGWTSVPGGKKPTFLAEHGHLVLNPALPNEDFEESVRIANAEFQKHHPDIVVGSSRGGAVAANMDSGDTPLVLLCPAWTNWGSATHVKPNTVILHSRADDVIPFSDSEQLVANSGLPSGALVEVGNDHRLADAEPLQKMLQACERLDRGTVQHEVTVYYLEMLAHSARSVAAPRDGLTVVRSEHPSVAYYRYLYTAVGQDYHWLSRRKLSDDQLASVIQDPRNELYVLHVYGTPAGFTELDRHEPNEVELVQFGLTPEFIGQGLGKWFLQWTIDRAWSYEPQRFWLHTCTLDHPNALPTYKKAGLALVKEDVIRREL
jgi:hypothetical protein